MSVAGFELDKDDMEALDRCGNATALSCPAPCLPHMTVIIGLPLLTAFPSCILCSMTTPENLEEYRQLYIKCVVRDTPLAESGEGIKAKFTVA